MNNTTNVSEAIKNNFTTFENVGTFLINSTSLILNLLSVFIFYKNNLRNKSRYNLFNYFLVASLNSSIEAAFNIFSVIIFVFVHENNIALKSSLFKIYYFSIGICTLAANLLELTSSWVRLLTISERLSALRDRLVDYKIVVLVEIIFCMVFVSFRLILSDLVDMRHFNQFSDILELSFNMSDSRQAILRWLAFSFSFTRDIVCILFLFIVNVWMVVQFRLNIRKKKMIQGGGGAAAKQNSTADKSQNDVTLMIIVMSLTNIVCHLPYFLIYQPFTNYFSDIRLYVIFSLDLIDLSVCFNFFIFLKFNRRFRENFYLIFAQLFSQKYNANNQSQPSRTTQLY